MNSTAGWHVALCAILVALTIGAGALGATRPDRAGAGGPLWELSVDCDTGTTGVQSVCSNVAAGTYSVDITIANNTGAAANVAAAEFELIGISTGTLSAAAGGFGGNPDFNEAYFNSGFNCGLVPPIADSDPSATATKSFLQCFDDTGVPVVAGETVTLATVTYTAGAGAATFSLSYGVVGDDVATTLVNCIDVDGLCLGATVGFGEAAPGDTPSPTSTATHTPTVTPTPTAVPTATPVGTPIGGQCARADVNHDGRVDILDMHLVGRIGWHRRHGGGIDVNGDGQYNALDLHAVARARKACAA